MTSRFQKRGTLKSTCLGDPTPKQRHHGGHHTCWPFSWYLLHCNLLLTSSHLAIAEGQTPDPWGHPEWCRPCLNCEGHLDISFILAMWYHKVSFYLCTHIYCHTEKGGLPVCLPRSNISFAPKKHSFPARGERKELCPAHTQLHVFAVSLLSVSFHLPLKKEKEKKGLATPPYKRLEPEELGQNSNSPWMSKSPCNSLRSKKGFL